MKGFLKKRNLTFAILVAIFAFFLAVFFFLADGNIIKSASPRVCFEQNCFGVDIAKTASERARGLMFVQSLEENRGMIFIFEEQGIYSFWMKNTFIPLDIIWIDKNAEVVFIKRDALPCAEKEACESIVPDEEALYVLELNSGASDKIGLDVGDKLEIFLG